MSKKMGNEQTLSFGGTVLDDVAGGCIVGTPSVSGDIDTAISNCAGQPHMRTFTGNKDTTISFDMELESDAVTLMSTTLARGTRGAVIYRPFGGTSGDIQIDATDAVVTTFTMNAPINGLVVNSYVIKLSDFTPSAIV